MRSLLLLLGLTLLAETPSPRGLPPVVHPPDNPPNEAKVRLGHTLFFDPRLSRDGTLSCATCHQPHFAFADGRKVSIGINHQAGKRNAPSIINAAYFERLFWDGRAGSLEEQALGPLTNPIEMGNTPANIEKTLRGIPGYAPMFRAAFGDPAISVRRVQQAIATFERRVLSGDSPYDRFLAGDVFALSDEAQCGLRVFERSGCQECHQPPLFTSKEFTSFGVGNRSARFGGSVKEFDEGRYGVTQDMKDWRTFRVPGLRETTRTGPWMHDGSFHSIRQVIDSYSSGGPSGESKDKRIVKLNLSESDKIALQAFLESLNSDSWKEWARPPARLP
jgi:cytochrome c peroxidase